MKELERIASSALSANVTRRDALRLAGLAAVTVALSSCQVDTAKPSGITEIRYATGGAPPPTEMEMAIFSEPLQKSVLQHYGKEYTVRVITTQGTPEAQSLLISGQADLATLAFSTIATTVSKNAVEGGISVTAAQYVDGEPGYGVNPYFVLADSTIESAADLKGKTLGVNAVGSAVDIILRVYLLKHGLDPKSDVNIVEVGFGAMGAALREGRIDLGSFVHPFTDIEQATGGVRALFVSTDAVAPYAAIATVARNRFCQQYAQSVRAFFDDWVRGLDWLLDEKNREQAIQIISSISKSPPKTLSLFYGKPGIDYYRPLSGCPAAQMLQVGVDAMVTTGYLSQRVEIAPLMNTSFLPNAC